MVKTNDGAVMVRLLVLLFICGCSSPTYINKKYEAKSKFGVQTKGFSLYFFQMSINEEKVVVK
mgnify:CR=1 FL=1